MKHALVAASVALLCAGCVQYVTLSPSIRPNTYTSKKIPLATAVLCSPELLAAVALAKAGASTNSVITYHVKLGEPLCATLTRSAQVQYPRALRPDHEPGPQEFDRILEFDLLENVLDVEVYQAAKSRTTNKVAYKLSVSIETYDGDRRPLNRTLVTGTGKRSRASAATQDVVREAVELALQQLADNASNVLIAGLAEPQRRSLPASPKR